MKIKDISRPAERVEPDEVAKALGAERISDVEQVIQGKIKEAIERTQTNRERFYLIRWVLVSAQMQGLIEGWNYSEEDDHFMFDIQISLPMVPRLLVKVPFV